MDEQFSGLLPQTELEDNMQIHGEDEAMDLDADTDFDSELADDDLIGEDSFDAGDDFDDVE